MNSKLGMIVAVGILAGTAAGAAEGQNPFHVENSLRVGFDDNVTYAADDKIDSFYITDEIQLSLDNVYETGFLGLRYRPSVTWFEGLEDDKADWTHAADITWNQQLSRTVSLTLQDAFMYYDRSDIVDADGALRQANYGYTYNSAVGGIGVVLTPKARLNATVRSQMLMYDDELLANREDYDIMAGGLSLGYQVGKQSTLFVDGSYEDMAYDGSGAVQEVFVPGYSETVIQEVPNRDAQTLSIGLGYENVFSPNLLGRVRAGYSSKDLDAANVGNDDSPYGEISVTITPMPTTRLTLGAGYSMYQSGVATFASQRRTTLSAVLAHDITSKITLSLVGQYYQSDYDAETSVDLVDQNLVRNGTEDVMSAALRASYRVNRNNYVDAGYTYSQFESDFAGRVNSERNRVDLGWRIRI